MMACTIYNVHESTYVDANTLNTYILTYSDIHRYPAKYDESSRTFDSSHDRRMYGARVETLIRVTDLFPEGAPSPGRPTGGRLVHRFGKQMRHLEIATYNVCILYDS